MTTPSPRLMRIHFAQIPTSVNFGNPPKNIHLMQIYSTSAFYLLSTKICTS